MRISDRRELEEPGQYHLGALAQVGGLSLAIGVRAGWCEMLLEQRTQLRTLLRDSPSLMPSLPAAIGGELLEARVYRP